jgi:RNA-directed DNA polymerase
MTSSILQDIARASSLKSAWIKVSGGKLNKSGALRAGFDGQSLVGFSQRLDSEVAIISNRISSQKFKFSSLDPYFIPKKDGKFRVICVPTVTDRVVQRAVLDTISKRQKWMANRISYGFVSEGGVERAAQQAIKYRKAKPWVFKTDITKFFDHVNRDLLCEKIERHVRQKSLHSLLFDAVKCEIKPRKKSHVDRIKKLDIIEGRGVRQGMPLSPFFANLFLADFDRECVKRNLSVLRYADDLIFFGSSELEAKEFQVFCATELAKIQLEIPALAEGKKTQIYEPTASAEFLGVELALAKGSTYQVQLGQKQLDAIKDKVYSLGNLSELRQRNLDISRFGNSLASRVAAYSATYEFCSNHQHLETCLHDWSKATRQKVAKGLGINLDQLSTDGRWFLGLD